MSTEVRYKLADDIFFDKNAEGILVMGTDGESYRLTDAVSRTIWEQLAAGTKSLDELEQQIRQIFTLTGDEPIREDLIEFLKQLTDIGIVVTTTCTENITENIT
ncbi:PqqD family protein [Brevibacillus dissolubilis]|uniref:PqqD family protein n=1 Tax=Brevibacillus dissolubilis TaxID=1844116 RepID=UPI001115D8FE|nr:PqqD family protein [Brevibacillus dissolubilis]